MFQLNALNRSIYTLHPRWQHHVHWLASSHTWTHDHPWVRGSTLPFAQSSRSHAKICASKNAFIIPKCLIMAFARFRKRTPKQCPSPYSLASHTHSTAPLLDLSMPLLQKEFQPLRIKKTLMHHTKMPDSDSNPMPCWSTPPTTLRFVSFHCANRISTRNYTSQYNADTNFPNSSPH
jgi:hypothetical protein